MSAWPHVNLPNFAGKLFVRGIETVKQGTAEMTRCFDCVEDSSLNEPCQEGEHVFIFIIPDPHHDNIQRTDSKDKSSDMRRYGERDEGRPATTVHL